MLVFRASGAGVVIVEHFVAARRCENVLACRAALFAGAMRRALLCVQVFPWRNSYVFCGFLTMRAWCIPYTSTDKYLDGTLFDGTFANAKRQEARSEHGVGEHPCGGA